MSVRPRGRRLRLAPALRRARLQGTPHAWARAVRELRRAVAAAPPFLHGTPGLLLRLAEACAELHAVTDDPAALREAVAAARQAVSLLRERNPARGRVLSTAGALFLQGGMGLQEPRMFEEAIEVTTASLDAGGGSLLNLAYGRRLLYEHSGDAEDLARGEKAARSAVEQRTARGLEAADEYSELAQILRYRLALTADRAVARQAVSAARSALAHTPEDDEDAAYKRRSLLAGTLTECHEAGDPDALAEAVALVRSSTTAYGARTHFALAQVGAAVLNAWADRHQDLDVAREAELSARTAVSVAGAHPERRALALDTLADVLRRRYALTQDLDVLDESIVLGEQVVALGVGAPGDRAGHLGNLGTARFDRFLATGARTDLAEAIRLHRQALSLIEETHPDRPMHLNNLGVALAARARFADTDAELDGVIDSGRDAVERSARCSDRAPRLSNLGSALHDRYQRFGALADLDEDIDHQRAAVRSSPPGHPDLPGLLSNLAGALSERYDRLGGRRDLDEALAALRDALAIGPRPGTLATVTNAYGLALHASFRATGDQDVLEQAVSTLRAAIAAARTTDPELPLILNNLVSSLQEASAHRSEAADEAVDIARRALGETSHEPARAQLRGNLALALHARHRHGDLDEAVALAQAVVDDTPQDRPDRGEALSNLAFLLHSRHDEACDPHDHHRAVLALRSASLGRTNAPGVRLHAARSWGRLAARTDDVEDAAEAFALAVALLPDAAPRRLERPDAQHWLADFAGLASDAAAMSLACDNPERALSLLELGRGVLIHRALGIRGDTAELRDVDATLADRFEELRDGLDRIGFGSEPHGHLPGLPDGAAAVSSARSRAAAGEDRERRRDIEAELETVVQRIRAAPGLAGFQQPLTVPALLAEAVDGPIAVINISSYRCDAILLTTDGLRHVPLPGLDAHRLRHTAAAFHRDAIAALEPRTPLPDGAAARGRLSTTLDLLWRRIAGPVLAALSAAGHSPTPDSRLWWVPTQALCQLPLHAATSLTTGESVVDLTTSSYTPTVTALHRARQRGTTPAIRRAAVVFADSDRPDASALPAARREVRWVAERFGVTPMDAARTDRSSLLTSIATCSHLHLALHAKADAEEPDDSRFLLQTMDLTFGEVATLRNGRGRLAYLSACETTGTVARLVDESIHLTSAFQLAGFSEVVGTQWRVQDAVAEAAARCFYTELDETADGAARALARAVRQLRQRFHVNPAVWAAHHHVGG